MRHRVNKRPSPEALVLQALVQALGPLSLASIRMAVGLTTLEALQGLDVLIASGRVQAMGDQRYALGGATVSIR